MEFHSSILQIFSYLKERKKFSFSKYADGEFQILTNKLYTNCDGWRFDPSTDSDEYDLLEKSFLYKHPNYIVGISCPCCQPWEDVNWMRTNVGSLNVTWANLFVNSNYNFFLDNFIPEFDKWEGRVILFANENGLRRDLPFRVDKYIPLKIDSWKKPYVFDLIKIAKEISDQEKDQLFLFSGGPLGNILSHLLHEHNQFNTYLDIGSTINPWIVGKNRGYLKGNNDKICIW